MLWIWQRKSNNIHDLNSHVWDEWADENGSIGKAYGYQMQVKHQYKEGMMDQVDRVIYDLKNNPFSRRIMTNIYVHQDLHEMNLYPCAYGMTFNVTQKKGEDRLTLNAILNQRSQDVTGSQQLECGTVCGAGAYAGTGLRYERGRAGACHCGCPYL